jgi:DHA1 family tetracycline resistance protein-like MFS transporter
LQGAVNAANSLATIIGPVVATQIFSYFTSAPDSPGYFPGAPWVAAAGCVVLALILFATAAWRFELGHRPSIANKPIIPDMAPPGQIRVPPMDEDDNDAANPPRR